MEALNEFSLLPTAWIVLGLIGALYVLGTVGIFTYKYVLKN
jgi:hypothetical protein